MAWLDERWPPLRFRALRARRELGRRLSSVRVPGALVAVAAVVTWLAWSLRWHAIADVAFFAGLVTAMYTADSLLAPAPGEADRDLRLEELIVTLGRGGPVGGGMGGVR